MAQEERTITCDVGILEGVQAHQGRAPHGGVDPTVTLVANSIFLPALELWEDPGKAGTRPGDPT